MSLTKRLLQRGDVANEAVAQFSCGDLPRDKEVADFLRVHAIEQVEGNRLGVWLYFDDNAKLVGFSSLGRTEWGYPKPNGQKVTVQIIPYMAVSSSQQGKGYSRTIVGDVIAEAVLLKDATSDLLGLYVHVDNAIAIGVYFGVGFENYAAPRKFDGEQYQRMLLRLPSNAPA